MKTEYKYIRFEKGLTSGALREEARWVCVNHSSGGRLGIICWYFPWHQFVFQPEGNTEFSAGCLADIIDFIKQLKE